MNGLAKQVLNWLLPIAIMGAMGLAGWSMTSTINQGQRIASVEAAQKSDMTYVREQLGEIRSDIKSLLRRIGRREDRQPGE